MNGHDESGLPAGYARALAATGGASLAGLEGLEWAQRRLHPPETPRLRQQLGPVRDRLEEALDALGSVAPPPGIEPFHAQLASGAGDAARGSPSAPAATTVHDSLEPSSCA